MEKFLINNDVYCLGRKTHNNHKRFIWIKKGILFPPHLNQDCKKKLLIVWNPFIFSAHFNQVFFFIYYYNKICILSTQNYCEDHIIISFFWSKRGTKLLGWVQQQAGGREGVNLFRIIHPTTKLGAFSLYPYHPALPDYPVLKIGGNMAIFIFNLFGANRSIKSTIWGLWCGLT